MARANELKIFVDYSNKKDDENIFLHSNVMP